MGEHTSAGSDELPRQRIDETIVDEFKAAHDGLSRAIDEREVEMAQAPIVAAIRKQAAQLAAHRRCPESIAAAALLKKLYAKREALLDEGRGADFTPAQRRARSDLALAITRAEIARDELPPRQGI